MSSVFIYHHMGLGDHIIANGLVRSVYDKYDKTFLFVKPNNFGNVAYMYRDLPNLKLIPMHDGQVRLFMEINKDNNYLIAGHENFWPIFGSPINTLAIDEIFYKIADVPIENKWNKFYIRRDLEKEKWVFNQLGLKEGVEFAFIHDDEKREITKELPNMRIVRPSREFSFFDFIYTIEKAKEVHCINSSFFCLIDCMKIEKENMYLHEYARKDSNDKTLGKYYCNWKLIK